jgi:hypothetical protein
VIEVNLLRQKVKVRMEREENAIKTFAVEEIAVLRNGKAKKNDPPIQEDLAPISGVARKPRKVEEEAPAFLEPIKFRYSEEAVVEEPAPAVVEEEEVSATEEPAAKPGRSRSRNRRNRHKGEKKAENTEAKKPEKPVEEKKAEKPAAENSGEEKAKKPHHHRRRYHHRGDRRRTILCSTPWHQTRDVGQSSTRHAGEPASSHGKDRGRNRTQEFRAQFLSGTGKPRNQL